MLDLLPSRDRRADIEVWGVWVGVRNAFFACGWSIQNAPRTQLSTEGTWLKTSRLCLELPQTQQCQKQYVGFGAAYNVCVNNVWLCHCSSCEQTQLGEAPMTPTPALTP